MARLMPLQTETKLRAQLGRFGFGADRAEVAVGKLSGGEKARLLFALMSREAPHVLILDEPTNHLTSARARRWSRRSASSRARSSWSAPTRSWSSWRPPACGWSPTDPGCSEEGRVGKGWF